MKSAIQTFYEHPIFTGLKTETKMFLNKQFPLALCKRLWHNSESARRHREKVAQVLENPFGLDAYVVVCAFSKLVFLPPLDGVEICLPQKPNLTPKHSKQQ